jgi:hypothetical protein
LFQQLNFADTVTRPEGRAPSAGPRLRRRPAAARPNVEKLRRSPCGSSAKKNLDLMESRVVPSPSPQPSPQRRGSSSAAFLVVRGPRTSTPRSVDRAEILRNSFAPSSSRSTGPRRAFEPIQRGGSFSLSAGGEGRGEGEGHVRSKPGPTSIETPPRFMPPPILSLVEGGACPQHSPRHQP